MFERIRKFVRHPVQTVKEVFSAASTQIIAWYSDLTGGFTSYSYRKAAKKAFRNPYVWKAIWVVSSNIASIPLLVTRETEDGEMEELPDHPIHDLLKRPNDREGWISFLWQMIQQLYLGGEIWLRVRSPETGPNQGVPRSMHLWRRDRFSEFITDEEDIITGYKFRNSKGNVVRFTTDEMLQIRIPHPLSDTRGFPIILSVLMSLDLMEEGSNWNLTTFKNKGRVPAFFRQTGGASFGDPQFERTLKKLKKGYRAAAESADPMLVEKDFDVEQAASTPKEADWLEGHKQQARQIGVGLGVDPSLLGDAENKTYSNLKTSLRALFLLTAIPLLEFVLDELNHWLMPRFGNVAPEDAMLTFNPDQIEALQEDRTEKMTRMKQAVQPPSVLSIDEARKELGFEERGGPADDLYLSTTQIPIGELFPGEELPDERQLSDISDDELTEWLERAITAGFTNGHG